MKQYETIEQIIASDITGLLEDETTMSRWGLVVGIKGEIPRTLHIRFRSYERALQFAKVHKREGYNGCMFRERKDGNEWILTATEEF